ncbi:hypothetical protein LDENG_00028450 [Lucifuga dentata]|nr:hypothetical protein LDENG_00028450 [Lucifuga dentata]
MENGSLLRVIDAHKSSVKCLFLNQWYLLSGDSNGQVMAWSISCDVKECLMAFNHPKEVKSLTLTYLRVVTGCTDGKIRIFNFLTGDCLRVITAADEPNRILSMHFHDSRILVNTAFSLKLCQFAKVFWDYTESAQGRDCGVTMAQAGLLMEKSAASLRKIPCSCNWTDQTAQAVSPCQKRFGCSSKKAEKAEPFPKHQTHCLSAPPKCRTQVTQCCETVKKSVLLSERTASQRMKKRGLHHPLTHDCILLRVNTIQRAQCTDKASINMEHSVSLQDFLSYCPSQDPSQSDFKHVDPKPSLPQALKLTLQTQKRPKTCVPILKRTASQNMKNTFPVRDVSTVPDATIQRHQCAFSKKA